MALNFKGVEYKTEWIEYPDLEPTLKSFGVPANDLSDPAFNASYTSPAVRLEDGTVHMDSWKIAHELEKLYPSPSLRLDEPVVELIRQHVGKLAKPLTANVIPKVPRNLLTEYSRGYYERTRLQRFGMPLSELEKEKGGERGWEEVRGPAEEAAELLRKNGGPFFLGHEGRISLRL